eukprot:m.167348 g.167348  ORF g.167348 m.167348 type:complete len:93 (-) comp16452_c3_seq7:21-299(-)
MVLFDVSVHSSLHRTAKVEASRLKLDDADFRGDLSSLEARIETDESLTAVVSAERLASLNELRSELSDIADTHSAYISDIADTHSFLADELS